MVREFELDPSADIWIVLDLSAEAHAGVGQESTEEYAVNATASLARHLLDQGRAVGLVSQTATLPADRGPRQAERILEVLALVRASSPLTLAAMLSAETSRFARSSSLIVVTPSTAEAWARYLPGAQRAGRAYHGGVDRGGDVWAGAVDAAAGELAGGGAYRDLSGEARGSSGAGVGSAALGEVGPPVTVQRDRGASRGLRSRRHGRACLALRPVRDGAACRALRSGPGS